MTIIALNWPLVRLVAWVKRSALALESIARSQAELVKIERERTPASREIRHAEMSIADVGAWNRRWQEEHPQAAEEGEI